MQLIDTHGRIATDLRVSLTDRCNLRCQYCMPAEGLEWMPTDETLTDDELNRLIRIGVEMLGVTRCAVHRRRAAVAPRPSGDRGRHQGAAVEASYGDDVQRAGAQAHREGSGRGRP